MSKYEALGVYLRGQKFERIPMTFSDIERVLKIKLPPSKQYRAWWSNNPSNNVMTRQWLDAGYKTVDVDPESGRLVFQRDNQANKSRDVPDIWERIKVLKGMITVVEPESLTRPVFEESDWNVDGLGRTQPTGKGK